MSSLKRTGKVVCRLVLGTLLMLASVSYTHSVYAAIYAYVDSNGNLLLAPDGRDPRFQRFIPGERRHTLSSRPVEPISSHSRAQHFTPLIARVAEEVGVEARLLHAIIRAESAYNPQAVSPKGALGLMQVIPATAARFGVSELRDPRANLHAGARYVHSLLAMFDGDLALVLAGYNAGEGAVRKYRNTIPPYPETQAYVRKVLQYYRHD